MSIGATGDLPRVSPARRLRFTDLPDRGNEMFRTLACLLCLVSLGVVDAFAATPLDVDLLITGGRVIDPASGFDGPADVAIADGRIVAVGGELGPVPEGVRTIDATGLVVAPGFIDLHVHGQSPAAQQHQARDGVTTALELEWGYPEVASFLEARRGVSLIHYGASASHGALRALARPEAAAERAALAHRLADAVAEPEPLRRVQALVEESFRAPLDAAARRRVGTELARHVDAGALGVGLAHAYYPGADAEEILGVFETAAALDVPIFTHARGSGMSAVQEVLANAAATGAALHVVHVNSTSLGEIEAVLRLIQGAREQGLDVSTEAYPYTAGSTSIGAALFDGDWQSAFGIDHADLQWQETGERLTAETFARYREAGGVVIIHMMREPWIEHALGNDWVMVASDGMPFAPGAHPRTAGTFARFLGRYVRERGLVDLPTAIAKMTLLPAQRLEAIAPQMAHKGRVQVGADADLVVLDPETVLDTATFETGPSYSVGIPWVLVEGVPIVADGELVPDVFPGRPILGRRGGEAASGRLENR